MATPRRTTRTAQKPPVEEAVEQSAPPEAAAPSPPPPTLSLGQQQSLEQQQAERRRGVAQALVDQGWTIVNAGQNGDDWWFEVQREMPGTGTITKRADIGPDGQPRWLT